MMAIIVTAIVAATLGLVVGCLFASARCNDCEAWTKNIKLKEAQMPVTVNFEDQKRINEIRITLAQVAIDLAGLRCSDNYSHEARTHMLEHLRKVGFTLDGLGLRHSCARRPVDG